MIEVLDGNMIYVTTDETTLTNRLFRVKAPSAVYYKGNKKLAFHWILHPITLAKLQIANK